MMKRCPDCAEKEGFFKGNGKCSKCDGTGTNPKLNAEEPECPRCQGTGVCATCGGKGRVER